MNTSPTIEKIAPAFLKAQQEMGVVTKNATAKGDKFSYTYAKFEDVIEMCKEPLNKNGILLTQLVRWDSVETVLMHAASGEYFSTESKIVVARLNDPQANGSGITYIKRYALLAILGLPTEDDDAQTAMPRVETKRATVSHAAELPKTENTNVTIPDIYRQLAKAGVSDVSKMAGELAYAYKGEAIGKLDQETLNQLSEDIAGLDATGIEKHRKLTLARNSVAGQLGEIPEFDN